MRFFFAVLGALAVAQCATSDDALYRVGQSPRAFVIIGVAETSANTSARYDVLWRRLNAEGGFEEVDGDTAIEAQTNARDTLRVRGIPGEFTLREVEPGAYALDSVYAVIRDRRVDYIANGVVRGPERPSFEVGPGEAVYLGIWQTDIDDAAAVVRPWRMSEADLRLVLAQQNIVRGDVRMRATEPVTVACSPRRLNNLSQRQVC
jgi:hypothetical protein